MTPHWQRSTRGKRVGVGALALSAVLLVVACSEPPPSGKQAADAEPAAKAKPGPTIDSEELARLHALGYLGYDETATDSEEAGVLLYDESRSAPGYNLYTNRNHASAVLMDARGRVVQEWRDPAASHWAKAELLASGDLLVLGSDAGPTPGEFAGRKSLYILRYAWNGDVVWKKTLPAHHDIEMTPDGRLLVLTYVRRQIPEIHPQLEVEDNELVLLSPRGDVLESRSLYEILTSSPSLFRIRPIQPVGERRGDLFIDLFHANTVEWMNQAHLAARDPIYAPRNVLVTSRRQDLVAIFDWDRTKLLWSWGPGEISGPHDATVLENGNILLFDNGLARGWSRVIELDPLQKKIVWQYRAPVPEDFFTKSHGSNQRLPGGNTLITYSGKGRAFELTPEGEVVWEFLNPRINDRGQRATIAKFWRYPIAFVEAILAKRELARGP